ncbi:MAG: ABC transporter permease [Lachnospiraceae bacterium]|nr:ABC transporter permease [Lachnospiraceae bacterium]MDE6233495.1 ABC transporter permease [Lachnospiraceae bacterium]MDE6252539.1 ABC transporter permease [Lachnospiraceae bacterium]
MSVSLECKKIKRTGFLPAFLGGGILAAAVPVINMAVRSEMYLNLPGNPIQILLDANWQMMTMLNVLLVVAGTCLLYHTEYADNAMQKMKSLPIRESSIFLDKAVLTIFMSLFVLAIEAGAVAFCVYHWFEIGNGFWGELCKYFGYSFLLMLPCVILSLLISEACKNMWVSLGIGIVFVFTATMLPTSNFAFSLFPFAMPFRVFASTDVTHAMHYIYAAIAEIAVLGLAQLAFVKIRRAFE